MPEEGFSTLTREEPKRRNEFRASVPISHTFLGNLEFARNRVGVWQAGVGRVGVLCSKPCTHPI